jgi:hypothetical protein
MTGMPYVVKANVAFDPRDTGFHGPTGELLDAARVRTLRRETEAHWGHRVAPETMWPFVPITAIMKIAAWRLYIARCTIEFG